MPGEEAWVFGSPPKLARGRVWVRTCWGTTSQGEDATHYPYTL